MNYKNGFKLILSLFIFLSGFTSLFYLMINKNIIKERVKNRIIPNYNRNYPEGNDNEEWAKKIKEGGYILFFRHAEREKWIDVQMYDAIETDEHNNGKNGTRFAENDFFSKAVCLNERGKFKLEL